MEISDIGPWVLLGTGVVLALVGSASSIRGGGAGAILPLIFGFALAGTGVFGQDFLPKHGQWLRDLATVIQAPSREEAQAAYRNLVQDYASGDIPDRVRPVVRSVLADAALSERLTTTFDPREVLNAELADATSQEARARIEEINQAVRVQEEARAHFQRLDQQVTELTAQLENTETTSQLTRNLTEYREAYRLMQDFEHFELDAFQETNP